MILDMTTHDTLSDSGEASSNLWPEATPNLGPKTDGCPRQRAIDNMILDMTTHNTILGPRQRAIDNAAAACNALDKSDILT